MKFLHTSDWHLGKTLEGFLRLYEQEKFLDELYDIAEREKVDIIIVAGDIYDSANPPAAAERLFYESIKRLSKKGQRPIIIIAGNHDSPERLSAASSLAKENAILIFGTPASKAEVGDYGSFSVLKSEEGFFEMEFKGENIAFITMPYPSEKRLNEVLGKEMDEESRQKNYSQRIGELFERLNENYRRDTINIAVGHFFVLGGAESGSERSIQLGGSYAVEADKLPKAAQYVALGHLHRPQTVGGTKKRGFYSGSPIQYSKDEIAYAKAVNIVEIEPEKEAVVKKVLLKNYKPIECWNAESIEAAVKMCEEHKNEDTWVYLNIKTDKVLEQGELKQMKSLKGDIVEVSLSFENEEYSFSENEYKEKNIKEQFCDFYLSRRQVKPSDEVLDLFLDLVNEKEDEDETKTT